VTGRACTEIITRRRPLTFIAPERPRKLPASPTPISSLLVGEDQGGEGRGPRRFATRNRICEEHIVPVVALTILVQSLITLDHYGQGWHVERRRLYLMRARGAEESGAEVLRGARRISFVQGYRTARERWARFSRQCSARRASIRRVARSGYLATSRVYCTWRLLGEIGRGPDSPPHKDVDDRFYH
jgi:hypothetical protein